MSRSRWQPPPMKQAAPTPEADAKPKVRVDEQVVRKMLTVNPDMRKGRTTFQVKKALESGEPVVGSDASASPVNNSGSAQAAAAAPSSASRQLRDTVDFFMRGKATGFAEARADIDARRKALDAEQRAVAAQFAQQVTSFLSLLDGNTVAAHGKAALAAHAAFLGELGLDINALLQRARQK